MNETKPKPKAWFVVRSKELGIEVHWVDGALICDNQSYRQDVLIPHVKFAHQLGETHPERYSHPGFVEDEAFREMFSVLSSLIYGSKLPPLFHDGELVELYYPNWKTELANELGISTDEILS